MKISPELMVRTRKISAEIANTFMEHPVKQEIGNNIRLSVPKGLSGEYFHPGLIKESEFDLEKTIENFNDIHDTKTIEKICYNWMGEYTKLLEDFTPQKISEMKNVKAEHQAAINRINKKYEKFTDKIYKMIDESRDTEEAAEIFSNYIEPITNLSMETYSKIDRLSGMSIAYLKH